ncbi:MAG: type II secretion system protein [bacterium]
MQKAGRNAFTLLELLVVITICAILAALLSRQYGAIRENGWSSRCKANLRSLYQAAVNYTVEHGGTYPNAGSWEWLNTTETPNMYYESRNGWVNWMGAGSWPNAASQASLMKTRWDGNSGRDSIKAGVLWEYTMREKGIYYCPKFCTLKRGADVARSYFMNSKYGCAAATNSINFAGSGDEASRTLLFADMQPQQKYLGSATDVCIKWAGQIVPFDGGVQDDGVLNGATAVGWPNVTEETIGYIHRMGGDYYGHVIFVDGHIEAVGMGWNALLQQDRTGAWTNRTYDACIGKF